MPLSQDKKLEVALLANPAKLRGVTRLAKLLDASGEANATVWQAPTLGELEGAVERALEAGAEVLVPGGGDGTVLRVLNALKLEVPLLIAPLGSSNDYAKALGHRALEDAVAALVRRQTSRHDQGTCQVRTAGGGDRTYRFCSTAGAGFGAAVVRFEAEAVPGLLRSVLGDLLYPPIAAYLIGTYPESQARLRFDDREVSVSCSLLELGKVPRAGGLAFTPSATTNSGTFDVCLGVETSTWRRFGLLSRYLFPRTRRAKSEEYLGDYSTNRWGLGPIRRLELDAVPPMPVHLNGEPVGTTPASFEIGAKSLELVAADQGTTASLEPA